MTTPTLEEIKEWQYGLGLVDEDTGALLHAVLYPEYPTDDEAWQLALEIAQDPEILADIEGYKPLMIRLPAETIAEVKENWIGR